MSFKLSAQDSTYQNYLKILHSKDIPKEIIENIIEEEVGKEIIGKRKIIAGEENEVYEIILKNDNRLILRISTKGYPEFQQERWVINKCREVGVSVPEILRIRYKKINEKEYAFCIMKKMEGKTLGRSSINFDKLNKDEQKNYIVQAGNILSKIHSIPTHGYGKIKGKGKTEYKNVDLYFASLDKYKRTLIELNPQFIEIFPKILKNLRENHRKPFLNHGDYFRKHFLVKDEKIVGILDWGEIRSDSQIYDFANWDFWVGIPTLIKWLKEGYLNKSLFDSNFEELFHTFKIIIGLENLIWYKKQKYESMIKVIEKKLVTEINYFK